jgi:hypothetical protein
VALTVIASKATTLPAAEARQKGPHRMEISTRRLHSCQSDACRNIWVTLWLPLAGQNACLRRLVTLLPGRFCLELEPGLHPGSWMPSTNHYQLLKAFASAWEVQYTDAAHCWPRLSLEWLLESGLTNLLTGLEGGFE